MDISLKYDRRISAWADDRQAICLCGFGMHMFAYGVLHKPTMDGCTAIRITVTSTPTDNAVFAMITGDGGMYTYLYAGNEKLELGRPTVDALDELDLLHKPLWLSFSFTYG